VLCFYFARNVLVKNMVVSQKQGSGKVGKLKTLIRLSHVYSLSIQVAALFT
jgi:Zn-dependent peptidase ImmA (M78 family)